MLALWATSPPFPKNLLVKAHPGPLLQFLDPLADDRPRESSRSRDHRNPSPSDRQRLAGCQQSPRPFIQFCRDSLVSLLDLFFSVHVS